MLYFVHNSTLENVTYLSRSYLGQIGNEPANHSRLTEQCRVPNLLKLRTPPRKRDLITHRAYDTSYYTGDPI